MKIEQVTTMSSSVMSILSPETATYKIQTLTLWGWADLKTSVNGEGYVVEKFDSIQDAQNEMHDMIESLNENEEIYRVVSSDTKQAIDIYE